MSSFKEELDAIFDLARVELTGVSVAAMKAQMYQVVHEFFNTSSAWKDLVPFNLVAGQTEYFITPDAPGQTIRLFVVVDQNFFPIPTIMPKPNTLIVLEPPTNPATVNAVIIKNVTLPRKGQVPQFPEWFFELYGPVFLDGLLGNMMNQPAKSYTNGQLATYHLRRFRDGINRARVAQYRDNMFGKNRWGYPQQFRVMNQKGGVSVGNAPVF